MFPHTRMQGHSLMGLLLAAAISALLWQAGLQAYRHQNLIVQRQLAKQALIHNALFLEQHYAQHQSFKAPGNTWPELPRPNTDAFAIRHSGQPNSVARADIYYLIAEALPHHPDTAILRLDQSQQVLLCVPSNTRPHCSVY